MQEQSTEMRTIPTRTNVLPLAAGSLCALLGLSVLVGWYTHNLALIHVLPAFVGMAFNTALGFFLAGISLAASAIGRPRVSLLAVFFALLVAVPTLAEYATGRSLGLDELLMHAYTRAGITQYGRMAVATALCFFLVGMACLDLNLPGRVPGQRAVAGLLGAVIAGLGIVALFGYVTGITEAYAWGQLTRMAVHTAGGFVLLGAGLSALAWTGRQSKKSPGTHAPRWLAGIVGIAGATASLCLWQALTVQERAQSALVAQLAARAGAGPAGLPHSNEMLTNGALAAGLLLSAVLAGAVSLAQTAGRQSQALGRAKAELEGRVQERTAELAAANESLAAANRAIRDVLHSVTDGKLRLCDGADQLPPAFGPRHVPIPLHRQDIRTLRHHVRAVACEVGLTPDRSDDLETAVGEAGMNAAVHGVDGTGEVYANARGTVQVWVTDRGQGIDMENLPRATLERGYTTAGTLGHGFWLMLNTVDRVWLLTGSTGTTVVLEQDGDAPPPAWLRSVMEA
jgi:anti-sigma regulatory factor (Ser/Thr protein kinase)